MAVISVTIIEGRDRETKENLMAGLTEAVVCALGAKPEQVRVIIHEVKDGAYSVGGRPVFLHGAN